MIDTNKVSFNFIKKEPFTGSDSGMRYRLEKHSEGAEDYILVHVWPEPYNFVSTEDALKTSETFPLTPEGKEFLRRYDAFVHAVQQESDRLYDEYFGDMEDLDE